MSVRHRNGAFAVRLYEDVLRHEKHVEYGEPS